MRGLEKNNMGAWVAHGEFHVIFYGVARQSLTNKVICEQKLEGGERAGIVESMLDSVS